MIGNSHLRELFECPQEDAGLNQLLELLAMEDKAFIDGLVREPADLDLCNEEEIRFLTKASALIDYYLQRHGIDVPDWLRDKRLCLDEPYYHSKHLSDFARFRLTFTSPGPFKRRNVFFDLDGIGRV